ncbi:5-oxoprolinase subunit PxpB [Chitinophaga japonensis]|uniref:Inhibitor of KinA n=1 Tax=Chitinophaga japonensis TaxID=104662 RepID=A0A562T432_CHIJA|nr:5-oxoprolinase subunit PxpB [Chitinophaga japonensis]TWI88038.1 inhibitor of KinA [Chitinophaga japonensis]
MRNTTFSIAPLGDSAIMIEWEQRISPIIHAQVMQAFHHLQSLQQPYITDLIPAYASLAVCYDAAQIRQAVKRPARAWITSFITQALQEAGASTAAALPGRSLEIPVCYHPSLAPDLATMAQQKGLSEEAMVALHTATTYTVYMLGFLPGFPYMGTVDAQLVTPRLKQPRTQVPAGSVGIAGEQTGIYPLPSPGGWNIIGRTPLRMFDANRADPCYCRPGDQVRFVPVSLEAFTKLLS